MNKYLLLFLFFILVEILPQEKYFIYFNDKGPENTNVLNKSSQAYVDAFEHLSPRAIERRKKNMPYEIITFEDLPVYSEYEDQLKNLGIKIYRKLNWFNCISAELNINQVSLVKELSFVKSVEPVKKLLFKNPPEVLKLNSSGKAEDTLLNYGSSFTQVHLSDIPVVHSKNINGKNVLIGVLDTGFDWERHESLNGRVVIAEYDFIFNDSVTANQSGDNISQHNHGTYVFSILAGYKDSLLIGPAFNSSFVLAKTEDVRSETRVEEDNYAAAIIWMESFGVDITTSSLGYSVLDDFAYTYEDMDGKTAITTKAVELAFERGVLTFASAGNEGDDPWFYITAPADGFNVLSVGAVNSGGNVATFSSRGPTYDRRVKPDVSVMGVSVFGASANTISGYGFNSGTSAAAPIAAGVGSLLLSAYPHLNNRQMRSIILETSSNASTPNNEIGYGIVSAKNAIEFPNLEYRNGNYFLHKAFLEDLIDTQSVRAIIVLAEDLLEEFQLIKSGDYDYTSQVPVHNNGEVLKFVIAYRDNLGSQRIIPESGYYYFSYGSDIISKNLHTNTPAGNYKVSDFYPNPFNPLEKNNIRFNYFTHGNENLNVLIVDLTGQKVFESSSITNSNPGFYTFSWNGKSNKGHYSASGIYLALIRIGDKIFGRKLVLIK